MDRNCILALDVGKRRTGIAVSDETRLIASPLMVIEAPPTDGRLVKQVLSLIEEYEVGNVLVGMPLNHHGEEGRDAKAMKQIIAMLQKRLPVPVIEWDERFTTVEAERILISAEVSRKNRKKVIDKVAAGIILQSYLDHLRNGSLRQSPSTQWQES